MTLSFTWAKVDTFGEFAFRHRNRPSDSITSTEGLVLISGGFLIRHNGGVWDLAR